MKRLVVIDGKSVFYRGYYAMSGLTLSDGTPVGGVYGFAAMALSVINELKPDYVAVAWDKKGTNIRRRLAIYSEYKAGRAKAPDDFYAQIPVLHELLECFGWPLYEFDDYEADDIIGTIARLADEKKNIETIIISSDLDMLQVVDSNTHLYALKKGFTDIEKFDIAALEEKYGIKQNQFLDLKALKGDGSDNIPGVPGIGEKSAVALLQEYGTLENIYENLEKIKPAWQKKLIEGKESAFMSRELGEIYCDAPMKLDLVAMDVKNLDQKKIIEELNRLKFKSLLKRLPEYMQDQVSETELIEDSKESGDSEFIQKLDLELEPILRKIEKRGVRIDVEKLGEMSVWLNSEIEKLETAIYEMAGEEFNIASPKQVGEILFEKLNLPTAGVKKTTRGYSTGIKILNKLESIHPIIGLIKKYRELAKLQGTYVDALPKLVDENGYIHTHFSQTVTATGRLSSSDPNLQNIPVRGEIGKRIRESFIASEGKVIVNADYSQFELRLAAALANDTNLIEDFNDETVDIHTKTAAEAFGVAFEDVTKKQRTAAKTINFGVLYGMSPQGLSAAANISFDEAKDFIKRYFEVRKPIREFIDKTIAQGENEGYVETLFGRRKNTPELKSSNHMIREAGKRAAANMPIQGTEADLMKMAMIKIENEIPEATQFMQIHDSIMVEADPESAEKIGAKMQEIMENIYPDLGVKLRVDIAIGKNWSEL